MGESFLIALFYLLFFGSVVISVLFGIKKTIKEESEFKKWVESAGFTYLGPEPQKNLRAYFENRVNSGYVVHPDGLEKSSYHKGEIYRGFTGTLPKAHNHFSVVHQIETRGSGKNKRIYKRTIASVQIPDTRLQLIINSKVNNDIVSGGNLTHYSKMQRFSLEGNFGTYFEVYMPETTQSESLSLLAPDVMHLILSDFGEFDIEINGKVIFLYAYRHLPSAELGTLLTKLDKLLEEFQLREGDSRKHKTAHIPVAHTIVSDPVVHRSLKRSRLSILSVLAIILLIAAALFLPSFIMFEIINNSGNGVSLQALLLLVIAFAGIFWAIVHTIRQILTRQRLKQRYYEDIRKYQGL